MYVIKESDGQHKTLVLMFGPINRNEKSLLEAGHCLSPHKGIYGLK